MEQGFQASNPKALIMHLQPLILGLLLSPVLGIEPESPALEIGCTAQAIQESPTFIGLDSAPALKRGMKIVITDLEKDWASFDVIVDGTLVVAKTRISGLERCLTPAESKLKAELDLLRSQTEQARQSAALLADTRARETHSVVSVLGNVFFKSGDPSPSVGKQSRRVLVEFFRSGAPQTKVAQTVADPLTGNFWISLEPGDYAAICSIDLPPGWVGTRPQKTQTFSAKPQSVVNLAFEF